MTIHRAPDADDRWLVTLFLSRQVDRARMAYGRLVTEARRQCVIFGTTNNEEYLRDTTGNRRFWPIRIKSFDLELLARDRDQLWAEAAAREAAGANIRLDTKLWAKAAEEQARRLTSDPFFDALQAALRDFEGKIAAASVWDLLKVQPGHRTQDQNKRVGDAMRKLGWRRPNKAGLAKIGGAPVSAYVKGEQPWRTIEVTFSQYGGLPFASYGDGS
jgi:predicted P-loop ATPase